MAFRDPSFEDALSNAMARSLAVREVVAVLMATEASRQDDAQAYVARMADILQTRLDELPEGIGGLKEKVRVEADWIVGAAQTWLRLGGR
jgi:hypothetical protein